MIGSTVPWMPFCPIRMNSAAISKHATVNFFGATFDFLFYDITSTYFEGTDHPSDNSE